MVDFWGSWPSWVHEDQTVLGLAHEGNHDFWGPWHQNPWSLEPWSHGVEVPGGLHSMTWATMVYLGSQSVDILVLSLIHI